MDFSKTNVGKHFEVHAECTLPRHTQTLFKAMHLSRNLSTKPVAEAVCISILARKSSSISASLPPLVITFSFILCVSPEQSPLIFYTYSVDDSVVGPPTPQRHMVSSRGNIAATKNNNPTTTFIKRHIYKTAPNGLFVTFIVFWQFCYCSRFSLYDGKQLCLWHI